MSLTPEIQVNETNTRIDPAHELNKPGTRGAESSPELLRSVAGMNDESSARQLRGQALELIAHLQNKHRLLERRESELNAKLAMLDNEARATRLRSHVVSEPRTDSTEGSVSAKRIHIPNIENRGRTRSGRGHRIGR